VVQGTGNFTGAVTMSGGTILSSTNTFSGTNILSGSTTVALAAGTASAPSAFASGDTNTGIFFPAADTIAFTEGGAEAMRIDSSGNVGIGVTPASFATVKALQLNTASTIMAFTNEFDIGQNVYYNAGNKYITTGAATLYAQTGGQHLWYTAPSGTAGNAITFTEAMRIDSSGNVGIGTTSPAAKLHISGGANNIARVDGSTSGGAWAVMRNGSITGGIYNTGAVLGDTTSGTAIFAETGYDIRFYTNGSSTERARITSGGSLCIGATNTTPSFSAVAGAAIGTTVGRADFAVDGSHALNVGRNIDDGSLVIFYQAGTQEGSISVSGNTVSYNAFSGSHWSQLQQGRGYNPDIPRGTVLSTIGEMCEWKSVVWDEVIEHPAVPAVETKEAVLDEEGNIVEPAVEAVEGKDAWTETIPHRETYLGQLPIGATFDEDGVTKTVIDDGNERLPKVKISDVVGDKAVYGVFQTWDEVQDMLVTSLGAFVVRIAAGVTVQIGDLLESNGDGCAKVQDDDVIRSRTIGKVTSTTATATYADGSYCVPTVLYCG
jgi:hypothetical protein